MSVRLPDSPRIYYCASKRSRGELAETLGVLESQVPEPTTSGAGLRVGKHLVLTFTSAQLKLEADNVPARSTLAIAPYWIPRDFRYVQSEDEVIHEIITFVRANPDAIGFDCTPAESPQRRQLEDLYHAKRPTSRLFRAPLRGLSRQAIIASLSRDHVTEVDLEALAGLRPIDILRYLGVAFNANIGGVIRARLLAANWDATDVYLGRTTLASVSALRRMLQDDYQERPFGWVPLVLVEVDGKQLALRLPGPPSYATSREGEAVLETLPRTIALEAHTTETVSIPPPEQALDCISLVLRAMRADPSLRVGEVRRALHALDEAGVLDYAFSAKKHYTAQTFDTLEPVLDAIGRERPHLAPLVQQARETVRKQKGKHEIPAAFQARVEERNAPLPTSNTPSKIEGDVRDTAITIWAHAASALLETLAPPRVEIHERLTFTGGLFAEVMSIESFGWSAIQPAMLAGSLPVVRTARRAPLQIGATVVELERTLVPRTTPAEALTPARFLDAIANGGNGYEPSLQDPDALLANVGGLYAANLVRSDGPLALSPLGTAIAGLIAPAISGYDLYNAIVRKVHQIGPQTKLLERVAREGYRLFEESYHFARTSNLDKKPWEPKKKKKDR